MIRTALNRKRERESVQIKEFWKLAKSVKAKKGRKTNGSKTSVGRISDY